MRRLQEGAQAPYRYRYFGGFRLLLATLVMLQHFGADLAPAPLAAALGPYAVGSMAVLVFFALSGFVITEAVDQVYRHRPAPFLTNRLLRIMPHFVVAVALSMLAHELFRISGGVRLWRSQPGFPDDAFSPHNVAMNFIGVAPMADRFIDYNFLDITWAVRVEMAFYVAMSGCIAIGRTLPSPRGFAWAACGMMVLLSPLFRLAIQGHGVAMLGFLPYFAFGGGLYFASLRSPVGWVTVALSLPAMLWQQIVQQAVTTTPLSVQLSWTGNLIALVVLLGLMSILALVTIGRGQGTDRLVGNLTYPLYLYHESVLIVVLTFTTGYSYGVFVAGMGLSLMTAVAMMALIDPLVVLYRDRVRGRAVQAGSRDSVVSDRPSRIHLRVEAPL